MSLYEISTYALDGTPVDLSRFAGQVTLVVNVASECGYTPQYAGLQALHERLASRGFSVLGFPSNEFGGQEPGSPERIQAFCSMRYGVTFPLFSKIETKPSSAQSPVYALLAEQTGKLPDWNFGKYVVGRDGRARSFFEPATKPDHPELLAELERALAEN
jgi:glutathione peroxidase